MLKRMLSPLLALAMIGLPLSAAQDKKEADRLSLGSIVTGQRNQDKAVTISSNQITSILHTLLIY